MSGRWRGVALALSRADVPGIAFDSPTPADIVAAVTAHRQHTRDEYYRDGHNDAKREAEADRAAAYGRGYDEARVDGLRSAAGGPDHDPILAGILYDVAQALVPDAEVSPRAILEGTLEPAMVQQAAGAISTLLAIRRPADPVGNRPEDAA